MIYGQLVAAGVIEEKANRIVEVLLTAVRPWQLMMGKITGIGLVALVQIAAVAAVALVLGTATKLVSIPTLGVDVVVSGVVWFVLGYLMYALLFAGAGSMVSRQEDVASVSVPVILVIVASWIIALTVAAPNPGSTATTIFSMIPLMSPVIMPVRIAAGVVPLWQVVLSVILVIATIYILAALAGRVYRNSVLRIGGRVKLGDALRLPDSGERSAEI
jgi:ABC-2 type transport system permease protein